MMLILITDRRITPVVFDVFFIKHLLNTPLLTIKWTWQIFRQAHSRGEEDFVELGGLAVLAREKHSFS